MCKSITHAVAQFTLALLRELGGHDIKATVHTYQKNPVLFFNKISWEAATIDSNTSFLKKKKKSRLTSNMLLCSPQSGIEILRP